MQDYHSHLPRFDTSSSKTCFIEKKYNMPSVPHKLAANHHSRGWDGHACSLLRPASSTCLQHTAITCNNPVRPPKASRSNHGCVPCSAPQLQYGARTVLCQFPAWSDLQLYLLRQPAWTLVLCKFLLMHISLLVGFKLHNLPSG